MIAPIEQPTSRLNRLPQPDRTAKVRSQEPPTSFTFDADKMGALRRRYHQWVWRHPIGAASAAIAVGLVVGLLLKRRDRK